MMINQNCLICYTTFNTPFFLGVYIISQGFTSINKIERTAAIHLTVSGMLSTSRLLSFLFIRISLYYFFSFFILESTLSILCNRTNRSERSHQLFLHFFSESLQTILSQHGHLYLAILFLLLFHSGIIFLAFLTRYTNRNAYSVHGIIIDLFYL